ncbi:MAG TPA: hypothetical protein VNO70_08460 [Blastocatellia bacterium]|nr:hypothetical protein [Blastocatellia bacterium]
MNTTVVSDELLDKTFQLAYFIHGDKQIAARIAADAIMKLEVAAAAQDKRLYYTPTGRSQSRGVRNKVFMSEAHLLQRLVYNESEAYECQKEQTSSLLGEEDMLIHFVKHLVKITVKRNSFYVTLGLSRLLHNYTTAETQDIYGVLVQDPDRVRDDYYYRSRKARLLREMEERFRGLVRVARGNRGEERFEAADCPGRFVGLVRKCLQAFTPWDTPCVVGAGINPFMDPIAGLSFDSRDPDGEHRVEVNRIHTALHPDCYSRLTAALGLDCPELRLLVPHFFLAHQAGGAGGSPGDRNHPPELSDEDRLRIRGVLAEQSARRRAAVAGLLRVLVDGRERARLDLTRAAHARFEIEEGAELIEVRQTDQDGELLLAAHLLEYEEEGESYRTSRSAIVLEGGQKITFSISQARDSEGAVVDVGYRETAPRRAAALLFRQAGGRAVELLNPAQWIGGWGWRPALALALFALLAAGLVTYLRSEKQSPAPQQAQQQPNSPPAPKEDTSLPSPHPDEHPNPPEVVQNSGPQEPASPKRKRSNLGGTQLATARSEAPSPQESAGVPNVPRPEEDEPAGLPSSVEATRAPIGATGVSLAQVKRVCIEPLGRRALSPQVRDLIAAGLQSHAGFLIVPGRDGADALLKVSETQQGGRLTIIAHMLNADGYVIWPAAPRGSGEKYTGQATEVTAKLVQDIAGAVQSLRRRQ